MLIPKYKAGERALYLSKDNGWEERTIQATRYNFDLKQWTFFIMEGKEGIWTTENNLNKICIASEFSFSSIMNYMKSKTVKVTQKSEGGFSWKI